MNPKPLQPDPTEVDVRAVRSVAYTLLHNLGRFLLTAIGENPKETT